MRFTILVLAAACADDPVHDSGLEAWDPAPPDTAVPLPQTASAAVPLFGGGIASTADWVAASDPDSDVVAFVHAEDQSYYPLALAAGTGPSAMAWAGEGAERLFVLLRGTGGLLVVEPVLLAIEPTVVADVPICVSPRGLAWDEARARMWVTCASGELASFSAEGEPLSSTWLQPDLRDIVILDDGRALVSRMRAAEVLVVDLEEGVVDKRWSPPSHVTSADSGPREFTPRLLRRMVGSDDGRAFALYQLHDTSVVEVDVFPQQGEVGGSYGGEEGGEPADPCDGIVRTSITEVDADTGFGTPMVVDTRDGYPVDLMVVGTGAMKIGTARGVVQELGNALSPAEELCAMPTVFRQTSGLATGLVKHGSRTWVTTREPFSVEPFGELAFPLGASDRTGLGVFTDSSGGIACVSCHVEGGDDGHTWNFSTGRRRTQSLGGIAVSETAPFHWNGEMLSFGHLMTSVGEARMGLTPLVRDEQEALEDLLDALPAPSSDGPPRDPTMVAQGRALFEDPVVGCVECHSGWRYSNGAAADVGTGGEFQVPSLISVGARLPLMHDGCAETVRERFEDPVCGGTNHGVTSHLSSSEIDALVMFLQTL